MSLRDLVESDCGGSNSVIKFSTHFVQDHAFKDKNLQHLEQGEKNDQCFLEASTEELADQFFSSTETETFKMDAILAEMRSAEASLEESWPKQLSNEIEKQDQIFDPNIWSSSNNKMLVKDNGVDYNVDWENEFEQNYKNEEKNISKSRFNFDQNNENEIKSNFFSGESVICDDLMESYKNMSLHSNIEMPPINHLGIGMYENTSFIGNNLNIDMFGQVSHHWIGSNYIENEISLPSTSGTKNPISVIGQSATSTEQVAQANEKENEIGDVDNQFDSQTWFSEYEEMKSLQKNKEYSFTPDNEMESIENPLVEGKRRLENGELPTAVLCFEAAVKQNPSNAEAWQLLGSTQAENEQDQLAINALNKCIQLQPDNLSAVLCLAACYTNESYNLEACYMLMEWLKQNPKYSDIVKSNPLPEEPKLMKYLFTSKLYEVVKDMYIEAAQRSLESKDIDVDVQNGLGVLLNLNNENDKAVDCFKAALQIKPGDARLWNRLGATLANGGRCEEAILAYHNALSLCPGFVRARYNLGITCIHLDTYREAIEHLLEALNQQASAVSTNFKSPALSDTIWSTLRLAISMAERPELLKAVNDRNLNILNEEFSCNNLN